MTDKYNKNIMFGKQRQNRTTLRHHMKLKTIVRLVYALERDVDKLRGQPSEERQTLPYNSNTAENIDDNLDLISNTLLEIRDKLESHTKQAPTPKPTPTPPQQNTTQPPISPFNQMPTHMPYNSYPFMHRFMF